MTSSAALLRTVAALAAIAVTAVSSAPTMTDSTSSGDVAILNVTAITPNLAENAATIPTGNLAAAENLEACQLNGLPGGMSNCPSERWCAFVLGGDQRGMVCCPEGVGTTGDLNGINYCNGRPSGAACKTDAMCISGLSCLGNSGFDGTGTCGVKKQVGESCSINNDCANGACARETAADNTPLTCCASGQWQTYAGYDYCSSMPAYATCWSDSMCESGYCNGNNGGLNKGTCRPAPLPVGASCASNGDCANGACARETAADGAGLTCCKSGDYGNYAGYDYCYGMPSGSVCWSDAQCSSGTCSGNWGGLAKGNCS